MKETQENIMRKAEKDFLGRNDLPQLFRQIERESTELVNKATLSDSDPDKETLLFLDMFARVYAIGYWMAYKHNTREE